MGRVERLAVLLLIGAALFAGLGSVRSTPTKATGSG
jgi:hypothetical protein